MIIAVGRHRPSGSPTPDALLSRTDLRELGPRAPSRRRRLPRLPTVHLPGYSRPLLRVSDYLEPLERSTYDGEWVR